MKVKEILKSNEDKSINFVFDNWHEARYVRREDSYFIVYLSSHDGCNKACRFCHLTQTGQTSFNETTIEEYINQAQVVLEYYDTIKSQQGCAQKVNFNFMARGEPLANSVILNNAKELFDKLDILALERNLQATFNISTILPKEVENINLVDVFKEITQPYMIYYSLYSVDPIFRKNWLPKAMDYKLALQKLENLQSILGTPIAFHWAFIKDKNDSMEAMEQLKQELNNYKITAKFNLVRYNPYSNKQGEESDMNVLEYNFNYLNTLFNNTKSRIVPRVGMDVKASCGMFVER
jgi:adenine C2-methylase RlmN of 23S rRNA A2503 and tRNA A37